MPYTTILVLEDGTRPAGANTYVSLTAAFDTYIPRYAADPDPYVGYDVALAELALVQAAKALDDLYGTKYLGYVYPDANQSLLFPRSSFYDNNGRVRTQLVIPQELKNAQTELAMLIYSGLDPYVSLNDKSKIKSKSVSIDGAISTSTEYTTPVEDEIYTGLLRVERVLATLIQKKQRVTSIHL